MATNTNTIAADAFFWPPKTNTIAADAFFVPPFTNVITADAFFSAYVPPINKIYADAFFVPPGFIPGTLPPPYPPGCTTCGAAIDCPQGNEFAYSITADLSLPFVENCPPGFDCNSAFTINLNCCGHLLTAARPPNATAAQLSAIAQAFIIQCQAYQSQCGISLPSPNTLSQIIMYAVPGTCTVKCPDGSPFTFNSGSQIFWGFTQQDAQNSANAYACKQANIQKICLSSLPTSLPINQPFSQIITATGFLATGIFENLWELDVDSNNLPPGLTLATGFYPTSSGPLLSGTPTTNGAYTFGVIVTNPNNVSSERTYTINVFGFSVTPDILSATVSYFNGGANFSAGRYRVAYITGALIYGAGEGWALNDAFGDGYQIMFGGGNIRFPGTATGFATQALVASANAGTHLDIMHTGGQIGVYLADSIYNDNVAGSPNPQFLLTPLS